MSARLGGRVVATTRDGDRQDPLVRALRDEGADVLAWPTLAFDGPSDPEAVRSALADVGLREWVVFTSARAVRAAARLRAGRPLAARVGAVGGATAAALDAAGWPVEVVGDGDGAQGLAAAMERVGSLEGVRVLFPAGSLAGDVLESALASRGARVRRVEAYTTRATPPEPDEVRADLARGVHAVAFASPSAVRALGSALDGDLAAALGTCGVAAIGETTAAALREAGVTRITVATEASVQGLVDACVRATGGS